MAAETRISPLPIPIQTLRYFDDRHGAMAVLVDFIYGRPLTPAESRLAGTSEIFNARTHGDTVAVVPGFMLGDAVQSQLGEYFRPHTQRLLRDVLPMLRAQGVHVYGFDSNPWDSS